MPHFHHFLLYYIAILTELFMIYTNLYFDFTYCNKLDIHGLFHSYEPRNMFLTTNSQIIHIERISYVYLRIIISHQLFSVSCQSLCKRVLDLVSR